MAGGPNAEVVACPTCAATGVLTRAVRVAEGVEDDRYRCEAGHRFGIDWSEEGPAAEPRWPPPGELLRQIRDLRGLAEEEG